MKNVTNRKKTREKELASIIDPFDRLNLAMDKNVEARLALCVFARRLSEMRPDKEYHIKRYHLSYLLSLDRTFVALVDGRYVLACHELRTLIHQEPFLQPRIYYNILRLLHQYCNPP